MGAAELRIVGRTEAAPRPATRKVEGWLAAHATAGQWTGPQGQIALGTQVSEKTVSRAISWLREYGYLKTEPVPRSPGTLTYYIEARLPAAAEGSDIALQGAQTSGVEEVRTPQTSEVRTPRTSDPAKPRHTPSLLSSRGPDPRGSEGPDPSDIDEVRTRETWRGIPLARVLHEAVGEETVENLRVLEAMTDEQIEWAVAKARQCRRELGEINPRYFARICNSARLRLGPELAPVDGLERLLADLDPIGTRMEAGSDRPSDSPDRTSPPRPALPLLAAAGWRRWVRPLLRSLDESIGGER